METYPWVCVGAAAVLGFLIVPKRSAAANVARDRTGKDRWSGCQGRADRRADRRPRRGRCVRRHIAGIAVREVVAYIGQNAGITGNDEGPGDQPS